MFKSLLLSSTSERNVWSYQISWEMSRNCSNLYSWNTFSSVLDDIRQLISFEFVFVWMPTGSMSVYFYSPTTVQIPAVCYQILPFKSYWHHIEGKYIKALSHPASWRADRPKHIAAEGDGARVRKTTRSSRWGGWGEGGGRRRGGIREMLKQGWCKKMREKRRGRSMEESLGGGRGVAHKDRQRISRGSAIHKKESRDYRERCRLKMEAQIVQWQAKSEQTGVKGRGKGPTRWDWKAGELERVRQSERQMSPSLAPADW